jgi:chromosomal replication initiation ATPase DnaA
VADETLLFHLYNLVVERRGKMLLTARRAPAHLTWRLPDLASRIGGLPAVALAGPDDTLLAAVLVKLFADRQIEAEPAVIAYLIARMERSFEAARRLVAALDRRALELRRPITVPLARDVLNTDFDFDDDPGGT